MTVFRSGATPPAWCELRHFEIVELARGESLARRPETACERLIGTLGTVQLRRGRRSLLLKEAQFVDIDPAEGEWVVEGHADRAQFVRLCGAWGEAMAGCGIFRVRPSGGADKGDPVDYPKNTGIDRHYHDCDEYWIVLEGAGRVCVDARHSAVAPGDCLAIGMGHHHDFPWVDQDVKAVFFETTLQGRMRTGHLWNHTHGPAQPIAERV